MILLRKLFQMSADIGQIKEKLIDKDLRVTPQRIAIFEAVYNQNNHPSAEMIRDYIEDRYPGISTATIYKVLDVLMEKQLISRVKTDSDIMRYDANMEKHHHLYCIESGEIRDYRLELAQGILECMTLTV